MAPVCAMVPQLAIAGDDHLVGDAVLLQRAKRENLVVLVVLHQQDHFAGTHHCLPPASAADSVKRNVAP
jgi:hypothetical protein